MSCLWHGCHRCRAAPSSLTGSPRPQIRYRPAVVGRHLRSTSTEPGRPVPESRRLETGYDIRRVSRRAGATLAFPRGARDSRVGLAVPLVSDS
jgi:hypothetical protein